MICSEIANIQNYTQEDYDKQCHEVQELISIIDEDDQRRNKK